MRRVGTTFFFIFFLASCGQPGSTTGGASLTGSTTTTPTPSSTSTSITTVFPPSTLTPTTASQPDTADVTAFDEYLKNIYALALYEAPPAQDFAYWNNQFEGGMTQAQIAKAVMVSQLHLGIVVNNYFVVYLGRQANSTEQSAFSQQITLYSEERVMAAILSSTEFYQNAGSTTAGWTNQVYQILLRRAPSSGESSSVASQIQSGTSPFTIALGLVTSGEYITNQFLPGLYLYYLNRQPDNAGASSFASSLANGTMHFLDVETAITATQEFFTDSVQKNL